MCLKSREKKTHKKTVRESTTTTIDKDGSELKKHEKTVTEKTITVIQRAQPKAEESTKNSGSQRRAISSASSSNTRGLTKIEEESRENEEDHNMEESEVFGQLNPATLKLSRSNSDSIKDSKEVVPAEKSEASLDSKDKSSTLSQRSSLRFHSQSDSG